MPTVTMSFEYEGLPWTVVNEHVEAVKRQCLMAPGRVSVDVTDTGDGETVYSFTGSTPVWARLFLPPQCSWRDTVRVDKVGLSRTERGENLTAVSDRCFIEERSRWYAHPERPDSTLFERSLEIRVRGFPDAFLRSCLGLYRDSTLKIRTKEIEQLRAARSSSEDHLEKAGLTKAGRSSATVPARGGSYASTEFRGTAAAAAAIFVLWFFFLGAFDFLYFYSKPVAALISKA
jgi:hypothetical protein